MKVSKEALEFVQHISIEEVLLEAKKQPSTRDHYLINLRESKRGEGRGGGRGGASPKPRT